MAPGTGCPGVFAERRRKIMSECYDMIIIGAGPAGMSAAIYAKRAGLSVLLLEGSFIKGGQVVNTYEVDNYPGLPGAMNPKQTR